MRLASTLNIKDLKRVLRFLSLGATRIMLDSASLGRTWKTEELTYPYGRGINFQIRVDSLNPIHAQLAKLDIQLFQEPEEKWYAKDNEEFGNYQLLVQDPGGYLLRLFQDLGSRPLNS